jgi:hypothetical protein
MTTPKMDPHLDMAVINGVDGEPVDPTRKRFVGDVDLPERMSNQASFCLIPSLCPGQTWNQSCESLLAALCSTPFNLRRYVTL